MCSQETWDCIVSSRGRCHSCIVLGTQCITTPKSVLTEIQCQIPDVDTTLKEASIIVNNLLHEEIKKSSHSQPSPSYALLNINEELNSINPLLLQFLTSITTTVKDRETTNVTEHIKKIRLY